LKNPLYMATVLPVWLGARAIVSRDYNAMDVLFLYFRTAGRSVDIKQWGGASITPSPLRIKNRGRGMIHEG
jgi:type IV secretion system protein VirB3